MRHPSKRCPLLLLAFMLVPPSSLCETVDDIPSAFRDASAVVLEDTRVWQVTPLKYSDIEVVERILVLDPSRLTEAEQAITYDATRSKITSFKARTVLPNGKVIEVSDALTNDVVLVKSEQSEWRALQFTFSSIRPGAILETEYEIHERKPGMLRVWQPQRDIPVLHSSFNAAVRQPAHILPLEVKAHRRGGKADWCEVTEAKSGGRANKLALECKNLPAFENEAQAPPERDVRMQYEWLWGDEGLSRRIWKATGENQLARIRNFVKARSATESVTRKLLLDAADDNQKIDRIYRYIKQNMEVRYLPRPPGSSELALYSASVDEVLANGGGPPEEIILLALAMLREAGFEAQPIMVADRSDGAFKYETFDSAGHLMLRVQLGEQAILLDPSCLYCQPGLTDWRFAAPVGPAGVSLAPYPGEPIAVGVIPSEYNVENRSETVAVSETGEARIAGTVVWSGQFGIEQRRRWENLSDSARAEEFLADIVGSIEQPVVTISDPTDFENHLSAEYAYDAAMGRLPDGRLMIRPLDVFSGRLPIPMQEERHYPLWFPFAFRLGSSVLFDIPVGYAVELPEDRIRLHGPGMTFLSKWTRVNSREVRWQGLLTIEEVLIPQEKYEKAREFARSLSHSLRGGLVAVPGRLQ